MRTLISITTLLMAAVAGAQPAPPAAPAAGSNATHEVRNRGSGATELCACHASGPGTMACEQCTPVPQPSLRVTGQGMYVDAPDFWSDISSRLRGDPKVRAVLDDLEIKLDRLNLEFVIACRQAPADLQYVRPGISMPMQPDSLMRSIRGHVVQACATTPARAEPTSATTTWAGCPAQDEYDRAGYNRTANPKIRITARPDSHYDQWSELRLYLVMDDLIYHCARELLIDPESADGSGDRTVFRANVTLV